MGRREYLREHEVRDTEHAEITTAEGMVEYIKQHEAEFYKFLGEFWNVATEHYGEEIKAQIGDDPRAAKNLCRTASTSMVDGLFRTYDIQKMVVGSCSLTTKPLHQIVKIFQRDNGKTVYLDPTYSQYDPSYAGKFLFFEEKDIERLYGSIPLHDKQSLRVISDNSGLWTLANDLNPSASYTALKQAHQNIGNVFVKGKPSQRSYRAKSG